MPKVTGTPAPPHLTGLHLARVQAELRALQRTDCEKAAGFGESLTIIKPRYTSTWTLPFIAVKN